MITVSNLSKTYKDTTVLSIESLELSKGEIIGLVGNNGAGKTTFFSLLLDLIKPSTGDIENNQIQSRPVRVLSQTPLLLSTKAF